MVLIQLLLPTSGAARADGLAPLAETRRELAASSGVSRPIVDPPRRDRGLRLTAIPNRTMSSWSKS